MARPRIHVDDAAKMRAYRERKKRESFRNASALLNTKDSIEVNRPALRYFGGKWRIADWIIAQFPPHICYVEPCGGGASVLLRKPPSKFEVLNDLDDDVINFFEILRLQPHDLIRAIQLTPYAREELSRAKSDNTSVLPLERARLFYIRCWQSFGSGTGKTGTGWRFQVGRGEDSRASAIGQWNTTDHLLPIIKRLKQVQIEHNDALAVIRRYDGPKTLFYVDPPYLHSTRHKDSARKGYQFEMTDQDHIDLSQALKAVNGMVILSGYNSELYDHLYENWRRMDRDTNDQLGQTQTESIWLSPRTVELGALPLFGLLESEIK